MKRFDIQLIHGLPVGDNATDAVNPPIYNSSTYTFGSVREMPRWDYARSGNPTREFLERQQENAQAIAEYLEANPLVAAVHYPGLSADRERLLADNGLRGFGGVLSFEVADGVDPEVLFDSLRLFHLAVSLGVVESLAELPSRMTHFELPREERLKVGITDGLIRLAVGIEDKTDLIDDLAHAFAVASGGRAARCTDPTTIPTTQGANR